MDLHRVIRFALVGTANTAVYYGCYLVLHTFLPYLVAHVCAFLLAMIGSYFLNCFFTFRVSPRWKTFLLFPLSNVANFLITTVGLKVAVSGLHVDERIAPLPVAVVAIPVTYVVAHYIMVGRLHTPGAFDGEGAFMPSPSSSTDRGENQ